jgi:hypothetical protein
LAKAEIPIVLVSDILLLLKIAPDKFSQLQKA